MLSIRKMQEEDLAEVAAIEKENFSRPWTEEGFRGAIDKENTCYICAFEDKVPVGYAGMWIALDEGEITNVSVKKEYQGQRIGGRLLEELFRIGKERGVTDYFLEVRKSNQAAIALYSRLGFQEAGVRKNFYEDPVEDGIVMCKR